MENGWPECDLSDCDYATVPGTPLRLPFRRGIPHRILQAFLRDLNEFIEPANNSRGYNDEGSWTDNNSVYTSNHKGASAFDYNWDDHPLHVKDGGWDGSVLIQGSQVPAVRELLAFYTFEGLQLVWWGNDWRSPVDSMHFQMGYGTATNQDKCERFIQKRLRADGFSTFRRGGSGSSLPVSKKDGYALAIIAEGRRQGITPKGLRIALATTLVETNLTMYANRNVPASLGLPHDAVGSDHDSTGLFQQRQAWGPLSETMDPTLSARLFFNGGHAGQRGLTDFDYNSNARTPGGWAQAVQVSAFPDRYDERMAEAERIYNRLSTGIPQTDELETLMASEIQSWSIYATPGEKPIPAINLLAAIDAKIHRDLTDEDARAGDLEAIRRVARTATGQGANKSPGAVAHAMRVLNEIYATNPAFIVAATERATA
jgi:hypothetical protein